jgi:hypothetical protein
MMVMAGVELVRAVEKRRDVRVRMKKIGRRMSR